MNNAKFHSNRGEKSALILVKASAFVFSSTPVYVPRTACVLKDGTPMPEGHEFQLEAGYIIVDMIDTETGEVRTAKDGSPLKVLQY